MGEKVGDRLGFVFVRHCVAMASNLCLFPCQPAPGREYGQCLIHFLSRTLTLSFVATMLLRGAQWSRPSCSTVLHFFSLSLPLGTLDTQEEHVALVGGCFRFRVFTVVDSGHFRHKPCVTLDAPFREQTAYAAMLFKFNQ